MRPRVVFSPKYEVDYGDHAFCARKFSLTADLLRPDVDLIEPVEPSRDDLALAHDDLWVNKVLGASLTAEDLERLELPFSAEISLAHRLSVGGTVLAARHALEVGVGLHCGGGSHHAFRSHGEGYCVLNDIAVAVLKLRAEKKIARAAVVDLDVHQGNGTASIFAGDENVFTFSMHEQDLYPAAKQRSSLDIGLRSGTGDAEYYDALRRGLHTVMDFGPELVIYQAGVDAWEDDRLGGLKLSERGLIDRDTAVWETCRIHGISVAVVLGGGYGPTSEDTARLHARTLRLFAGLGATIF